MSKFFRNLIIKMHGYGSVEKWIDRLCVYLILCAIIYGKFLLEAQVGMFIFNSIIFAICAIIFFRILDIIENKLAAWASNDSSSKQKAA